MGNTYLLSVTLVQNLKSSWHTEVICSKQIFLAMDELFPELLWIALFVGGDSSVQGLTIPVLCPSCRQSTHLFNMWKVVLLGLYTMLAVRGLAKGAPFEPEEKWKPLDNPRNRDLVRKCCKKHSLSFVWCFFFSIFHHKNVCLLNIMARGFSNYVVHVVSKYKWLSILQCTRTPQLKMYSQRAVMHITCSHLQQFQFDYIAAPFMNPKKNDYYVSLESVLLVAHFILTTFPSGTSL